MGFGARQPVVHSQLHRSLTAVTWSQSHRSPSSGNLRNTELDEPASWGCCDLGPSLRLSGLGFLPLRPEGEEAPSEAHAAAGSRAVTWPRSPQPRAAAPVLRGAQADRRRLAPSHAPHRGVLGWGPARGGPGAPRALTRGPRRLGPGAGGGASAGGRPPFVRAPAARLREGKQRFLFLLAASLPFIEISRLALARAAAGAAAAAAGPLQTCGGDVSPANPETTAAAAPEAEAPALLRPRPRSGLRSPGRQEKKLRPGV